MSLESLKVTDLRKEYPTPSEPLVVLRGVNLSLDPGDTLSIVGPSGSGKSTLLNILGTLDEPTGGSVRLGNVNPFDLSAADLAGFRSRSVGFIFQDHHLLPPCTALENVLIPKLAVGAVSGKDIDRGRMLLKEVGLEGRMTHLPAELSGGERQRVSVARALMNSPSLLLCDEPTGSLDATTGRAVADLIFTLAGQMKLILIAVTHSAELAGRFGKRMQMQDGTLREA